MKVFRTTLVQNSYLKKVVNVIKEFYIRIFSLIILFLFPVGIARVIVSQRVFPMNLTVGIGVTDSSDLSRDGRKMYGQVIMYIFLSEYYATFGVEVCVLFFS